MLSHALDLKAEFNFCSPLWLILKERFIFPVIYAGSTLVCAVFAQVQYI